MDRVGIGHGRWYINGVCSLIDLLDADLELRGLAVGRRGDVSESSKDLIRPMPVVRDVGGGTT